MALAFFFGYSLTLPVLRSGVDLRIGIALAADTLSITVMEIVDNTIIVAWPSAMEASLADALARGRGHAVAHQHDH